MCQIWERGWDRTLWAGASTAPRERESSQSTPALARRQSGRVLSWAGAASPCYNGSGMPLDKYWPEILVGLGAAGLGGVAGDVAGRLGPLRCQDVQRGRP